MRIRVYAVAVAGALVMVPAVGRAPGGEDARRSRTEAAVPTAPGLQDPGRAVFEGKGNCATCHGRNARGTPLGPDLTDGQWLQISGTLQEITDVVREGIVKPKEYPAPMPPMGGARLRAAEVEAVARYVLSLNPPPAP
jgi:mono/diheme cytochrome c family protein